MKNLPISWFQMQLLMAWRSQMKTVKPHLSDVFIEFTVVQFNGLKDVSVADYVTCTNFYIAYMWSVWGKWATKTFATLVGKRESMAPYGFWRSGLISVSNHQTSGEGSICQLKCSEAREHSHPLESRNHREKACSSTSRKIKTGDAAGDEYLRSGLMMSYL